MRAPGTCRSRYRRTPPEQWAAPETVAGGIRARRLMCEINLWDAVEIIGGGRSLCVARVSYTYSPNVGSCSAGVIRAKGITDPHLWPRGRQRGRGHTRRRRRIGNAHGGHAGRGPPGDYAVRERKIRKPRSGDTAGSVRCCSEGYGLLDSEQAFTVARYFALVKYCPYNYGAIIIRRMRLCGFRCMSRRKSHSLWTLLE